MFLQRFMCDIVVNNADFCHFEEPILPSHIGSLFHPFATF